MGKAVSTWGDVSKLKECLKTAFGADDSENITKVIAHAAEISTAMMDLAFLEDVQWKKNVASQFKGYYDDAKCEEATEKVREQANEMVSYVEEEEDDDDAEELCNCQFTLAYGTKILLHNTKMRLQRGKRYVALLIGNISILTCLLH